MTTRLLLLGVLLVAFLAAIGNRAQAIDGPYFAAYGYYGAYDSPGYATPYPPYFALYPPVYYSHHVARPYGYSPFAYPPGIMTPESRREPRQEPEPAASRAPLRIVNPYVVQTEEIPAPPAPQPARPAPKVVRPSASEQR
jgi:hypothetical protein